VIRCPGCSAEAGDSARFCPSCGEALSSPSQLPTGLATPSVAEAIRRSPSSSRVGRLASSDSIDLGGFAPGTMLAERYRIVGLLGRGGMGEVYRADDLKLGQPVALKFLPKALAEDPARQERFFAEVRLARQVSHPNVCRVYDLGEIEGRHFLSMEYVDGEDLASLLRRIGRLPPDKALEISRQLCAGLAAAHDRGVLHRDLKPSNVMVDGRGRARITDFGLAAADTETVSKGDVSGTPLYMAPEQLQGAPGSVRSDVYALGMVLYELWTGKRAYDAATLPELRAQKENLPRAPSDTSRDIEPSVERLILRCLERDPKLRPASALQAAASLPGGDPLAAALAAGETPSPEMVAAYGEKGVLSLREGSLLLGATLLLLTAFVLLPGPELLLRRLELEKPPEFLAGIAADLAGRLGESSAWSAATGFAPDDDYLAGLARRDHSFSRWSALREARPGPIRFWRRSSPRPLVARDPGGRVRETDPAEDVPGMLNVLLDARGRLISFRVVPGEPGPEAAPPSPDWKPFFAAAGFELERFTPVAPNREPRFFADARFAWEPAVSGASSVPFTRVEAASLRGKPVSFELVFPWSTPAAAPEAAGSLVSRLGDLAYLLVVLFAWIGGVILARRNWRLKRGDRRGAFRIALCLLAAAVVEWLLRADHTENVGEEWNLAKRGIGDALFWAVTLWIVYLALEPSVRRRWPQILISWNRLLAWDLRDPLVGRDVLLGALTAVALHLMLRGEYLVPLLFGRAPDVPGEFGFGSLASARAAAGALPGGLVTALVESLGVLVLLLLFRLLLRNRWLADAVLVVALSFILLFWDDPFWVYWPLAVCRAVLWIALATRVGLLAFATGLFFWYTLLMPINVQSPNFYAGRSLAVLLFLAALAVWGFVTALGGRAGFAAEDRRRLAA
jgi:hypothetical protein